jgi:RHH-type proline utilization regulon transcriptional repressor/proline dehydrogenase/delta 1-pyrroline-5-carboxylate dehydrogenase
VAPAADLVRDWLAAGEAALTRRERRERRQLQLLTGDERSLAFTMSFCDRVLRAEDPAVAAQQLHAVAQPPLPPFLSPVDRVLLRTGARLAPIAPRLVMPLTRRRLRQIVGGLVVDRSDPAFARHLRQLRADHFAVNVNLLGESVLGEQEAASRRQDIADVLSRPDVDYISVKASAVASQLNLWGYQHTLERVVDALRPLFRSAAGARGTKFINLDMEEYRDLRLTVDAFKRLLSEPELQGLDAGIVLQAYLPDSFEVLRELIDWAGSVGGTVKIRIVKGANLAMESVDAAMHGWTRAPYATKAETDGNYKRMLDWALVPSRLTGVRIGVASHNLFDVAWARLLAEARGVTDRVEMEMLQGMAPGIARAVRDATGSVRLYTPVVAEADFDNALAYLFRRLEENSTGENFLRRTFDLVSDERAFASEQARFAAAVSGRWSVGSSPRRRSGGQQPAESGFRNAPDSDPTDPAVRSRIQAALVRPVTSELPTEIVDTQGIDRVVARAAKARGGWAAESPAVRRGLLRQVSVELAERRPELIAVMAHEAAKTVSEGDIEASETIDMAAYYAEQIPGLGFSAEAAFTPLGTVLVTPPWNFPLAITAGGVLAALAAGNVVILKAPPQTPRCALTIAETVWAACRAEGISSEVLQYVRCPEEVVGEHLVGHPGVAGIVLTGARETARLFRRLAPKTPLFAETSGKNAIIVMPDADLDLAADDLVRSAFSHAGQKCSAASLGICVGGVHSSARFRGQLVDAARSLRVGPADDPATTLAPLIGPPGPALERALTTLEPGEQWLLKPCLVDADRHLWSPGIKTGVRPGSWFHQTECFGPVLGLMEARDLPEALAMQNGTRFGLTGGIHTLDPATASTWLGGVQVGNAYVNRVITGAVVQRQPFGGWNESVVGPGAKAGGPNYVAQLGNWADSARSPDEDAWLLAATRSDAWWHRHHFSLDHDPSGLFCESNVFRYRPLGRLVIRVQPAARPVEVARVRAAAMVAGCTVEVSSALEESTADFVARLLADPPVRVRLLGGQSSESPELGALDAVCFVDDRPPVADGRVEGLRYRREQSVSRTLHRFGNVIRAIR